jgi:carboxypeptidase family protein/TonB-dependent receptor-like protein
MREHAFVVFRVVSRTLVVSGVVVARLAAAQSATARGVVMDSSRAPIAEVAVAVVSAHQATRTDEKGRFTLGKLPMGEVEFTIRRIGYEPITLKRSIPSTGLDSFTVMLAELPQVMDAMAVSSAERHRRQGIEEFYFRRAQGVAGAFFARDDFRDQRASTPSDLLRSTPGVRLVRVPTGKGVRFPNTTGMRRGDCQPVVWLDGQAAPGMELDDVPLNDIEGIELYRGTSTTPGQFWRAGASQCGAIVVWTRVPGTP